MSSCPKRFIALLSLIVVVSCGSTSSSNAPAQDSLLQVPTIAITNAPETSTPQDLAFEKSTAGQKYLEIVNPVNCATRRQNAFEEEHSNGDGTVDVAFLDEAKELFGETAASRQEAYRDMLNYSWPVYVEDEIRNLAAEWAKYAESEQLLSEAFDVGVFNLRVTQMIEESASSTANPGLVRGLLGLDPSNVTDQC